ncbi:c-type cytochrome [Mesorhizobium sp. ES1-1]|uniref:c-type cytochrome n=1 Tax=Mesorhizobium sp. ES1-1 TaxID=2876629 RepID=UPI001CC9845F|nr:c-type cytochrome [Mesorhizobium sp. ES1-1]MBZ9674340.1 c-type cytochrome [Mesorhizobium sp. ES1-1]
MPEAFDKVPFRVLLTGAALALAAAAFVAVKAARDNSTRTDIAIKITGGDPDRAPQLFRRYGCAGCHTIPGIPGADGQTGAPLTALSKRLYIAGVLQNSPDNLVAWIVSPHRFSPQTAMPETGITEQEAKDLAAYLYAHGS